MHNYNTTGTNRLPRLNKMHNIEMITLKDIASYFNIDRRALMRWFKIFGIKHRSISEDNYRRYSNMTEEEIIKQTQSANIKMRKLMKLPEFKNNQMKKVMMAQCYGESKLEKRFKEFLSKQNNTFESQYQIGSYFADIAFLKQKLVVEIDGDYWHNLPEHKLRDKERDKFMKNEGWTILRVKEKDINRSIEESVNKVMEKL